MAFFEQLGKRLTDASQNVAQQTRNMADVSQLNSANSEKEKRINQLISVLGRSYYERHKDDGAAEDLEIIQEISSLYDEIRQNREKIKQIKGVAKCENCGADVPANAAFCNACGTKVARVEVVREDVGEQRRCPACNAVVGKDNLFCTKCGTKV